MKDRALFVAVAAALALLTSACQAKDPEPHRNQEEMALAWGKCRFGQIKVKIETDISAEDLADQALKSCRSLENEYMAASFGPNWRTKSIEQHNIAREAMIQRIIELRSGMAASNPFIAWGNCTGKQLQIERSSNDPVEISVNRIMSACKPLENAVAADAKKQFGDARSKEVIGDFVQKVRRMMASDLQHARSKSAGN